MAATNSGVLVKAAILAGGQGTRFWPISRQKMPKQFLTLGQRGESLLQATVRRISPLCGASNIIIVSNERHAELVKRDVPTSQLILEPLARNTAASIGLAALHVLRESEEGVMIVLPADHAVKHEQELLQTLGEAVAVASKQDVLVLIGIRPTFAHTGYGYLKRGESVSGKVYRVGRFYEKPNLDRAQMYLQSGEFFWNSGMFVWKARVVLEALAQFMPDLHAGLMEIRGYLGSPQELQAVSRVFDKLEPISIDFGVLEHARNCCLVAAADFGWSDVGSWDAWAENYPADSRGNVTLGDALLVDSNDCIVHSEQRLTAVVGASDVVVIDSPDALLVCPRDKVQEVKRVVEELVKRNRKELI